MTTGKLCMCLALLAPVFAQVYVLDSGATTNRLINPYGLSHQASPPGTTGSTRPPAGEPREPLGEAPEPNSEAFLQRQYANANPTFGIDRFGAPTYGGYPLQPVHLNLNTVQSGPPFGFPVNQVDPAAQYPAVLPPTVIAGNIGSINPQQFQQANNFEVQNSATNVVNNGKGQITGKQIISLLADLINGKLQRSNQPARVNQQRRYVVLQ